jgi:hypothetical protein
MYLRRLGKMSEKGLSSLMATFHKSLRKSQALRLGKNRKTRPLDPTLLTKLRPCPKRNLLWDMANALRRQQPLRPSPSRRTPLDWIMCAACQESSKTSTLHFFPKCLVYMSNSNRLLSMNQLLGLLRLASYNAGLLLNPIVTVYLAPRRMISSVPGMSRRAQPSLRLLAFAKEVQATAVLGNTNRSISL